MHSPDSLRLAFGALLAEQVRAVALALGREAVLAASALAAVSAFTVLMGLKYSERLDLVPEMLQPVLLIALLLPFAVWKGDPVFGSAFLWTMPVRRQTAALAKVLAGAFWLLAAMLVTLVSLMLAALATGGHVGIAEIRLVETSGGLGTAAHVPWVTPFWAWLVPFVGALLLYLASSAAVLGLRRPIRWLAGSAIALTLLLFLAMGVGPDGAVERVVEQVSEPLMHGRFGLDFALTGGSMSLAHEIRKPGPGSWVLWSELPEMERWAMAVLLWLGLLLLALALAIRRHWER